MVASQKNIANTARSFKKDGPLDKSNYGPVSILPLFSKAYEKFINPFHSTGLFLYSLKMSKNQIGFLIFSGRIERGQ